MELGPLRSCEDEDLSMQGFSSQKDALLNNLSLCLCLQTPKLTLQYVWWIVGLVWFHFLLYLA